MLLNPSRVAEHQRGEAAFVPVLPDAPTSAPEPSAAFIALGDPSSYELLFTNNSVVLEVEGAEADLTIVDLPGIIQFHEQGQRYVDLIKGMVTGAIQQDHTIIVMALTAVDDLENQASAVLSLLPVRACVCACVCACVRACVCACVRACVHACVRNVIASASRL